jgi:DNA-binding transcriptional LysR family regulator
MRTVPKVDTEATLAFVSVVDMGGFREAARSLGVPRSTLSERVQRLETQLGAQLLARTARSVTLTSLGERYYQDVVPALRGLWQAENAIAEGVSSGGRLRITAPLDFGQSTLPLALSTFAQRHPDVELVVDLTDRIVNVVEEGFDIAIRVGTLPDSSLTARRLGRTCSMGVFASPRYLEQRGEPITPEELRNHRCLSMSGQLDSNTWTFTSSTASNKQRRITIEPHIRVNSFAVLTELTKAGLGIARLPHLYARAVNDAQLRELLPEYAARPSPCHALFQGGRNQPRAVRAFLDVLSECYSGAARDGGGV